MERVHDEFRSFSLFEWNEVNHSLMSALVHSLKGDGSVDAWLEWAKILSWNLLESRTELLSKPILWVPSPPRRGSANDHAFGLAQALARIWPESEVDRGLMRGKALHQKRLSLRRRRSREFTYTETQSFRKSYSTVIFVDDVITSGATALAAWRALGQPRSFEVWTLVRRALVAPGMADRSC